MPKSLDGSKSKPGTRIKMRNLSFEDNLFWILIYTIVLYMYNNIVMYVRDKNDISYINVVIFERS